MEPAHAQIGAVQPRLSSCGVCSARWLVSPAANGFIDACARLKDYTTICGAAPSARQRYLGFELLGRGAFGSVARVHDCRSGAPRAVKRVDDVFSDSR